MRLPVILNSNLQIQDRDGVVVADLWRNPFAMTDGPLIVGFLNGMSLPVSLDTEVKAEVKDEPIAVEIQPPRAVLEPLVIEPFMAEMAKEACTILDASDKLNQAPCGVESPGSVLAPASLSEPKRKGNPLFVKGQTNPYMRKRVKA